MGNPSVIEDNVVTKIGLEEGQGLTLHFNSGAIEAHNVQILGTGSFVPERIVPNHEVGSSAGVDDAWIRRKSGISSRRWADSNTATSDLAARAAMVALEDSGIDASEISQLVVATSTPDHSQPATAAIVQAMIGAKNAAAYDLNSVCSGFEFALNTVVQMNAAVGGYSLVIGADLYSRILNPKDSKTVILFGDGAGAVILGSSEHLVGPEVIAGKLCTYGQFSEMIRVPMGGSRIPFGTDPDDELRYFQMDGRSVRSFVTTMLPGVIGSFLEEIKVHPEDVRHFIPHQANGVMLNELVELMDFPNLNQHLILDQFANTGAASIPLALDLVKRKKVIESGELVLMAGFGGGMSVGLTLLRW
ncbi:3-oxoacyl-ACP synthase III family protein [Corynebacterium freiburgense]|uniref:3-oxoacyl-ACP synthase III family protein n=1 Tax=Corynebacterium freiburgense TaxID=556548 RepID=UPI000420C11C|nr:ketoacyl-ACP synthase III [Corynebacterium freiburgense]WJZ02939.1 Acetoacetyl CoA synthase NphT7 [Corynebacterium freiburgense]